MSPEEALETLTSLDGYTIVDHQAVPEIDGYAYLLNHSFSKARILYLKSDNPDKAFSIAFRTPPQDSTGVFHILEHSVLCGSDKYPVKEPFVNLLKSSMQTFLNAMTFPDKTMYPVASTNQQDLLNLMDVYLDAVFHPAIYQKETIFQQEGWHFEIDEEGHLTYNGVVFNEMKGALSNADEVAGSTLQAELFPDTCYGYESGGKPEAIPTLSYEQFLEEHQRHYRLDNSYIILYGDMDIAYVLTWLQDRYLNVLGPGSGDLLPRTIDYQNPVISLDNTVCMNIPQENSLSAFGYVAGTSADRVRLSAIEILLDALAGSNESPLKRKLLDLHLSDDVHIGLLDGILQPFACVEFKGNVHASNREIKERFDECIRELLSEGINREIIEATIAHTEFALREANFSYSDGVVYAISAMSGWLYDDNAALDYLTYEDLLIELKRLLAGNYYENLLADLFLHNNHIAAVAIEPSDAPSQSEEINAERLRAIEAVCSQIDREKIIETLSKLRAAQEAEDTPESLSTLPRLSIEDLKEAPAIHGYTLDNSYELPTIVHDIHTRGIAYATRYYRLNHLSFEDVPYVSLLCRILGKVATKHYSPSELDTAMLANLGSFSLSPLTIGNPDDIYHPTFYVSVYTSALEDKVHELISLTEEIIATSKLNDKERIRSILSQLRLRQEDSFINSGHTCALNRALSYVNTGNVIMQYASGVDFYLFIKDLIDHFDEEYENLINKLEKVQKAVFEDAYCEISFAGSKESKDFYWKDWSACSLPHGSKETSNLHVPLPTVKNEAFIVPTDIAYTAISWDIRLMDQAVNPEKNYGIWKVLQHTLNYDYLWNEVRVKGGAYGVGFKPTRLGSLSYYSYRDPHFDETLDRFDAAASWLEGFNDSAGELEGYIISTVSDYDKPKKPAAQIKFNNALYLSRLSWEDIAKDRQSIIGMTIDDLKALSPVLDEISKHKAYCVFGNKGILSNTSHNINVVELVCR